MRIAQRNLHANPAPGMTAFGELSAVYFKAVDEPVIWTVHGKIIILQLFSGTNVKHKPRKTRIPRKPVVKTVKDPNSSDSQEKLIASKEINKKCEKNEIENDSNNHAENSEDVKNVQKKNQLEKRKTEAIEWKSLKKLDYQRLETVMEEGQLSSEETLSKSNASDKSESDSEIDQVTDFGHVRKRKSRVYELVAISEQPEFWKNEDEDGQPKQLSSEKGDSVRDETFLSDQVEQEPKDGSTNKNINFNGMMEILPIFSNDKFVCSRDAISIEECEELEPLDKRNSSTGDGGKKDGNMSHFEDRLLESVVGPKDPNERKLRYKMLTDRTLTHKTSSHFINSLLVLNPFATEREKLLKGKKQTTMRHLDNDRATKNDSSAPVQRTRDFRYDLKPFPVVICATLGIFSLFLGLAWKSYKPPCMIDYILEFIPFIRRRRTYVQLFFDQMLKIVSNVFSGSCER